MRSVDAGGVKNDTKKIHKVAYEQRGTKKCRGTVCDYEYLYVFALEELIEQLFKNLEEAIEVFKRDCFPDGVPYGFPEFLRKQIQLNTES